MTSWQLLDVYLNSAEHQAVPFGGPSLPVVKRKAEEEPEPATKKSKKQTASWSPFFSSVLDFVLKALRGAYQVTSSLVYPGTAIYSLLIREVDKDEKNQWWLELERLQESIGVISDRSNERKEFMQQLVVFSQPINENGHSIIDGKLTAPIVIAYWINNPRKGAAEVKRQLSSLGKSALASIYDLCSFSFEVFMQRPFECHEDVNLRRDQLFANLKAFLKSDTIHAITDEATRGDYNILLTYKLLEKGIISSKRKWLFEALNASNLAGNLQTIGYAPNAINAIINQQSPLPDDTQVIRSLVNASLDEIKRRVGNKGALDALVMEAFFDGTRLSIFFSCIVEIAGLDSVKGDINSKASAINSLDESFVRLLRDTQAPIAVPNLPAAPTLPTIVATPPTLVAPIPALIVAPPPSVDLLPDIKEVATLKPDERDKIVTALSRYNLDGNQSVILYDNTQFEDLKKYLNELAASVRDVPGANLLIGFAKKIDQSSTIPASLNSAFTKNIYIQSFRAYHTYLKLNQEPKPKLIEWAEAVIGQFVQGYVPPAAPVQTNEQYPELDRVRLGMYERNPMRVVVGNDDFYPERSKAVYTQKAEQLIPDRPFNVVQIKRMVEIIETARDILVKKDNLISLPKDSLDAFVTQFKVMDAEDENTEHSALNSLEDQYNKFSGSTQNQVILDIRELSGRLRNDYLSDKDKEFVKEFETMFENVISNSMQKIFAGEFGANAKEYYADTFEDSKQIKKFMTVFGKELGLNNYEAVNSIVKSVVNVQITEFNTKHPKVQIPSRAFGNFMTELLSARTDFDLMNSNTEEDPDTNEDKEKATPKMIKLYATYKQKFCDEAFYEINPKFFALQATHANAINITAIINFIDLYRDYYLHLLSENPQKALIMRTVDEFNLLIGVVVAVLVYTSDVNSTLPYFENSDKGDQGALTTYLEETFQKIKKLIPLQTQQPVAGLSTKPTRFRKFDTPSNPFYLLERRLCSLLFEYNEQRHPANVVRSSRIPLLEADPVSVSDPFVLPEAVQSCTSAPTTLDEAIYCLFGDSAPPNRLENIKTLFTNIFGSALLQLVGLWIVQDEEGAKKLGLFHSLRYFGLLVNQLLFYVGESGPINPDYAIYLIAALVAYYPVRYLFWVSVWKHFKLDEESICLDHESVYEQLLQKGGKLFKWAGISHQDVYSFVFLCCWTLLGLRKKPELFTVQVGDQGSVRMTHAEISALASVGKYGYGAIKAWKQSGRIPFSDGELKNEDYSSSDEEDERFGGPPKKQKTDLRNVEPTEREKIKTATTESPTLDWILSIILKNGEYYADVVEPDVQGRFLLWPDKNIIEKELVYSKVYLKLNKATNASNMTFINALLPRIKREGDVWVVECYFYSEIKKVTCIIDETSQIDIVQTNPILGAVPFYIAIPTGAAGKETLRKIFVQFMKSKDDNKPIQNIAEFMQTIGAAGVPDVDDLLFHGVSPFMIWFINRAQTNVFDVKTFIEKQQLAGESNKIVVFPGASIVPSSDYTWFGTIPVPTEYRNSPTEYQAKTVLQTLFMDKERFERNPHKTFVTPFIDFHVMLSVTDEQDQDIFGDFNKLSQ